MTDAILQPNLFSTGESISWATWIASCHLDCDLTGKSGFPNMYDQGHTRGWFTNPNFSFVTSPVLPGRTYSGFSNGTASTAGAGIWENLRPYSAWNGLTYPFQALWPSAQLSNFQFTVEAWIYFTAYNIGTNTYYLMGPDDPSGTRSWILYIDQTGHLAFRFQGSNLVVYTTTNSSVTVPTNQWNHVCAMRSGDTIYLFLNGTMIASTSLPAGLYHSDTTTFEVFECRNNRTGFFFTGYWDQALFSYCARYPVSGFTPDSSRINLLVNSPIGLSSLMTLFVDTALSFVPSGLYWNLPGNSAPGMSITNNYSGSYSQYISGSGQCAIAGNGIQRSSIKHYFEVVVNGTATSYGAGIGIGSLNELLTGTAQYGVSGGAGINFTYPTKYAFCNGFPNINTNAPSTWGNTGSNLGIAAFFDGTNIRFWLRVNGGAWGGGGDPSTNTSPTYIFTTSQDVVYYPACSGNYGSQGMTSGYLYQILKSPTYTIPSGFSYWT